MMTTISKDFEFSASHQLVGLPDDHPCSRLHGHNYTVRLTLEGHPDEVGFVVDYRDLAPFKKFLDEWLDHRHLNDIVSFNPTAENLAGFLADSLAVGLPGTVTGLSVGVSETPKTWATVTREVQHGTDPISDDKERFRWGHE